MDTVKQPSPNLLLIILDTVRADALDSQFTVPGRCYRAANTISTAPWTLPSCTSMMTGRDAVHHRHYWREPPMGRNELLEALPGRYRKIGLVNNDAIGSGSGVEQGFNRWKRSVDHEEPFERALHLIKRGRRRHPYFIVLHSNIAHDYYRRVADRYLPPGQPSPPTWLGPRVITWRDTNPAEVATVTSGYAACVTALAERVGVVLDAVRQRDDFVTAIIADHGEGFDPDGGRVHHGGRVHQDLLRVPAFFDLPSSLSTDARAGLSDALESKVMSGTDVLPTMFDLAGYTDLPATDGGSIVRNSPRTLTSEDRKYLYLKDRFRLNYSGKLKNMSEEEIERNQSLCDRLAESPAVRSYIRYPDKCIVTSVRVQASGDRSADRAALENLGGSLPGSPVLVIKDDRLFAFEQFDLAADPLERENLLLQGDDALGSLLATPWTATISMPTADGPDIDLASMLEGGEQIGPLSD
jgi:hypothetical protein